MPRTRSELNPQRNLADAIPAGVTGARLKYLSECALAVNTFTQIVARIIEVWMVREIGKAALELQLKPLGELEILGQPQGEVNCSGANQRPHAGIAKAAN